MATAALVAVLGVFGGTAAATEPDTTPPAFVLSGSAIKAVEEEAHTGSYELHIAATDGSEASPQSGVAKIEVSVDGSGQQSWEKYCPEGSCSLEESWTWIPGNFSGAYHVLTVKVTDHAGNTTEEEITPQGIEEVPREREHGTDTTPPKISFSGTAVEAAETGATSGEYELRMLASDGTTAEPQSGISRIEVAVDGTTLQSFEKYCPVGNCRLRVNWPYDPANFSGTEHVITVTVKDHAGNVTTRTLELDRTPPVIELSGPLTEGLKEGTTEYPLHVHATDGEPEFPQSGVKKIEISVDGEVVETVEQTCRFGSCPMDAEWVYDSETYPGETHEITVEATDFAGNTASEGLSLNPPDGSIPACSPTGGQPADTADEITPLPGGGYLYVYDGAEGTAYEFPVPPAGFDPLSASNAELEEYAYETRPSNEADLPAWEAEVKAIKSIAPPGGCVTPDVHTIVDEGALNQAGYVARKPSNENEWSGARAIYVQPSPLPNHSCTKASDDSSWVSLGGGENGFFQAGTEVESGGKVRPFAEMFFAGHTGPPRKSEQPIHPKVKVGEGDEVMAVVKWDAKSERAIMRVVNLTTGVAGQVRSKPNRPGLYYGGEAAFMAAERSTFYNQKEEPILRDLKPMTRVEFEGAELFESTGGRVSPGEVESSVFAKLSKLNMENLNKKGELVGQRLAETSGLGSDEKSFSTKWLACQP